MSDATQDAAAPPPIDAGPHDARAEIPMLVDERTSRQVRRSPFRCNPIVRIAPSVGGASID